MAVEKVGIYRKWLGPVPERNGKPIPRSEWPKKRRHRWIVRWCGTNNKKYGKVFHTRKEAERHALELQARVNLGRADRPRKVTIHEFIVEHEEVMKGQVAYATLRDHVRALRFFEKFIGSKFLLSKTKPRHAEAFIAHRLSTVPSVATVNKDIRTLKRIFNLAIEPRGYLAEGQNPFAKIKERKITESEIRYVTVEEYHRLGEVAENIWWRALFSLAYGSGLRHNEILHLTWADIDFENQRIKVSAKKDAEDILEWEPKNRRNRIVPMSDESSQLLVNIQAEAPEGHPYVLVSPERLERIKERRKIGEWNPRSAVVNNLTRDFNVIRRRANVAECTLHDFRRSAITNWAQRSPIQVVQTLAGHSNIATTRKYYLAVRPEDFAAAGEFLNSILARTEDD
ncbi:MAG: site-specific integrase [Sedimentisphaerales bacterium]|nr:site-specific integrase [Sedimentisphaerales bacterium]